MVDIIFNRPEALAEFVEGERVIGMRARLGHYVAIQSWVDSINTTGTSREAFQTVGRWRRGEGGNHSKAVHLPHIYIDIDRDTLIEALDDTREILSAIEDYEFDPERVTVSFSGSKGFHIAIRTDQIASPIFRNGRIARDFVTAFCYLITGEHIIDPAVYSPYQLIRLSNSLHIKTGFYKTTTTMERFLRKASNQFVLQRDYSTPTPFIETVPGLPELGVSRILVKEAMKAVSLLQKQREERNAMIEDGAIKSGIGPVVSKLIAGVEESQTWHSYHSGRNSAAFILACFLLEGPVRQRAVASRLSFKPEAEVGSTDAAWELLLEWNRRNTPPYTDEELMKPYKSAKSTVLRNEK